MNVEHLLAHYHRIVDAPNAIPRLRRFVLDLAIRGKLVGQDRNDKAVLSLLKRNAVQGPLVIPDTWAWARVGDVAEARLGKMLDQSKNKGTPRRYLRNINVRWFDFDLSDVLQMRFEDSELSEFRLRTGDVLICEGGEPGRAGVWDERETDIYFQKAIHRVRFSELVDPHYFVKVLRASADDGRLAEYFTGTGIQHFTGKGLDSYIFPLPPLPEQRRIVTKVDELTALCDQLEAALAEREATRDRLATASLARLRTTDPNPAAFADHAGFVLDNLASLTPRPKLIGHLRQTILTLAVHGQLVRQNPSDEAAPVESEWPISTSVQLPLTRVPAGWRAVPLAKAAAIIVDCPHSTPKWTTSGKICVRTNQFRPGHLDLTDVRFVSEYTYLERIERLRPAENDILYSREGGILGVACRVPPGADICLGQRMMLIRAGMGISPAFLELVLNSPLITDIAKARTTGGAAPRVNVGTVKAYPIPIPPPDEQQRIVAKVNQLMALCDRLEASVANGNDARRRLLDALLAQALAPESRELEAARR